jgi:hypothetical protein
MSYDYKFYKEHDEKQKLDDIIDREKEPYRNWNARHAQEHLVKLRLEDAKRSKKAEEARKRESYEQGEAILKLFDVLAEEDRIF